MTILSKYTGDGASNLLEDPPLEVLEPLEAQDPRAIDPLADLPDLADPDVDHPPPPAPCPACGCPLWWLDRYGGRHCIACRRPTSRTLVAGTDPDGVPLVPHWWRADAPDDVCLLAQAASMGEVSVAANAPTPKPAAKPAE